MARLSRPPAARTRLTLVLASALRHQQVPRRRIAEAASRPGYAESRPWMACGGESGMDACRAGEHAPVGTTLFPTPAYRPVVRVTTIAQCRKHHNKTPPRTAAYKANPGQSGKATGRGRGGQHGENTG